MKEEVDVKNTSKETIYKISESKTHILFVIPPTIPYQDLREPNSNESFGYIISSIPMGSLSLAGYTMKHAGAEVSILDMNTYVREEMKPGMNWNSFLEKRMRDTVGEKKVDIVGISAIFNVNAGYMPSISDIAKKFWPEVIVVAGGRVAIQSSF